MDEQQVLAVIRTLLAYERNYLSIERTQLAQLRTGLTLALITPPATATLAYAFEFFPNDLYVSIIVYVFLIIATSYGVWMTIKAYVGLKKTRRIERKIQQRQLEVLAKSNTVDGLLKDILDQQA